MSLKEYQEQAKRTCPSLDNDLDIPHMIYGMMSEISELAEAVQKKDKTNIGEEACDFLWYFSNYCTFRKIDIRDIATSNTVGLYTVLYNDSYCAQFSYQLGYLADIWKKNIAYGKTIDSIVEEKILSVLYKCFKDFMDTNNLSIEEFTNKNIAKLKQRYPEKFTIEHALNRDLDAERQILEG